MTRRKGQSGIPAALLLTLCTTSLALTGSSPTGQTHDRRTEGSTGADVSWKTLRGGGTSQYDNGRRRLQESNSTWQFLGAVVPFLKGPTLGVFNSSFFRFESVIPKLSIDWRKTKHMTPVMAQSNCASCWAIAAADAVAISFAVATNTIGTPAGVQQICDCSGMGCCFGGWPEDAMAYMVSQGNITTQQFYSYLAMDGRSCAVGTGYPIAGKVGGWERVPNYSEVDLMKAVNMQPVLVYISASSPDFLSYRSGAPGTPSFNIYDGNCSSEVNHAMLAVGYETTGANDYWILKNTWSPSDWGHNGFMYIALTKGPGKCGMMTVNPIFSTYFPYASAQISVDPVDNSPFLLAPLLSSTLSLFSATGTTCPGVVNPCGAGDCYLQNGVARCKCPAPYVEVQGSPTSKCVHKSPCAKSMWDPCGAGICMDYGDGSYICGCPAGYAVGTLVTGAPTCVPVSTLQANTFTYVAQTGDTCQRVQAAFNISADAFTSLNPYIKCSRALVPGMVLVLAPSSAVICTQQYAVRPGDTCRVIAYYIDNSPSFYDWLNPTSNALLSILSPILLATNTLPTLLSAPSLNSLFVPGNYNPKNLLALNPTLNCSRLNYAQPVCVRAAKSNASAIPLICGRSYTTGYLDSCTSVRLKFGLSLVKFLTANPALSCDFNLGILAPGIQICIAAATSKVDVNCTDSYSVQQGDTCAQIRNAAGLTQEQLLYINPGLQCQHPYVYVGQQICINSPLLDFFQDPSFKLYVVRPNDTWSSVQAAFASVCEAKSITVPRIAAQNNISDWSTYNLTAGSSLIVPCVPKVGASCGCAASLPVCGADLLNYNSYCDARCNFATPVTDGACSSCQNACAGRYGRIPSPTTACPSKYVCPWPQWEPPKSDASASFTKSPLCSYRTQTCNQACSVYNSVYGLRSTDTTCYNACMACQRVPCSGPSTTEPVNSTYCPTCISPGCKPGSRSTFCTTDCQYWNSRWNPINP